MRVLVTGATGFVGGWLLTELAQAEPQARLWGTEYGPGSLGDDLAARVGLLACDLTNADAIAQVVRTVQPERVFHLAGFASAAGNDADLVTRANVDGAVYLLRALEQVGQPCRVLLASSGYAYGATAPGRPAEEEDALAPAGVYAESKRAMEQAAKAFVGKAGLSLTVTRAFNHTGPRQGDAFVVPAFCRQIARIEHGLDAPVVRVGNLQATRDFLHVRDVVRAYRLLLDREPDPWRVVNVCSGTGVMIQSLLDALVARARVPVQVEPDAARMRASDLPTCVGNPNRLTALTGWQPRTDLDQTLEETLQWWRNTIEH